MISLEAYRCSIANADIRQFKILNRKLIRRFHCIGVRWCLVIAVLLIIGCVEANPGPGNEPNDVHRREVDQVSKNLFEVMFLK